MSSNVEFSSRGVVHLPLGGQDRMLRYRTHELSMLEKRLGRGILSALNEERIGLDFLKEAIIVGVAHEFQGKDPKTGRRKTLTEVQVCKWIDDCEDNDNISFDELLEVVIKAIVGGMPGGARYVNDMETAANEAEAAEAEAQAEADKSKEKPVKKEKAEGPSPKK